MDQLSITVFLSTNHFLKAVLRYYDLAPPSNLAIVYFFLCYLFLPFDNVAMVLRLTWFVISRENNY